MCKETSVFASLDLKKVKPLSVPTDFDVYENYYFGSDVETLVSKISPEVNKTLRQGYGLLNDEFLVRKAVLNRERSIPGVCLRLHFYRPKHFESFCTFGQEHSVFHEQYFNLCARYLSNQFTSIEFILALKTLEKELPASKGIFIQEYYLFTSPQTYDENIPAHIYKEEYDVHPYIEMYNKAKDEAARITSCDLKFVNYYPYQPIINGTLLNTSVNNLIVFIGMCR